MEKKGIRAVGYLRVSVREQLEGHSLDAQEHNVQEYMRSQGWEMVSMYTDAGISAKKDSHRPGNPCPAPAAGDLAAQTGKASQT
jgi:hypothetical protein